MIRASVFVLAITACASESTPLPRPGDVSPTCEIPDDSYRMTFTPIDGTCPADITDRLQNILDDDNKSHVIANGECRPVEGSMDLPNQTVHDCTLSVAFSADGTESGLENGTASLSTDCGDGLRCTHDFDVTFSR